MYSRSPAKPLQKQLYQTPVGRRKCMVSTAHLTVLSCGKRSALATATAILPLIWSLKVSHPVCSLYVHMARTTSSIRRLLNHQLCRMVQAGHLRCSTSSGVLKRISCWLEHVNRGTAGEASIDDSASVYRFNASTEVLHIKPTTCKARLIKRLLQLFLAHSVCFV